MKLPQVEEPQKYIGLYVVDFGDHSGVGFTADEVAELLDSEQFAEIRVYRIYRAYSDGTMELKDVTNETFLKESGMFFYAGDESTAHADYNRLMAIAATQFPPVRCKVHSARTDDTFVTAIIYPAEYEDAMSTWLLRNDYKTSGQVQGGADAVRQYYASDRRILDQAQLWPADSIRNLQGTELLDAAKRAVVR